MSLEILNIISTEQIINLDYITLESIKPFKC